MNDTRNEGRGGIAVVAEYASQEFRNAERLDRRRAYDSTGELLKPFEADRARDEGLRLLKAPSELVGDASTELVPAARRDEKLPAVRQSLLNTLDEPNIICVDASEHRAALATRAGVFSHALDAQVSVQADNSIEKMLVHQMTVVHTTGMETIIRLQQTPTCLPPVEHARLINSAARRGRGLGPNKPGSVSRREEPAFNVSYRPLNVSYRPGEWQTYDIRLSGRDVTIVLNGKTLIDRKQVEGLTAIASDPNEAEPGPIVVHETTDRSCSASTEYIDAAREGWRKSANDALSQRLMGLPL